MRDLFPGYVRPSDEDLNDLWEKARIVVDANVLLDIYRYSDATRDQLLAVIEKVKPRLWLPWQFAQEFYNNRAKVVLEQAEAYTAAQKAVTQLLENFISPRKHPFISQHRTRQLRSFEKELGELARLKDAILHDDPFLGRIETAFTGRVGPQPDAKSLGSIHEEAERRYKLKIPPGYEDVKEKGAPACYGDYIGWRQIMDFAKSENSSVLFVTGDSKDDWWYRARNDRTIGPRPELLLEFKRECGLSFHMYSTESFLRFSVVHFGTTITEEAISEVAEHSTRDPGAEPKSEPPVAVEDVVAPLTSPKAEPADGGGLPSLDDKKWQS